LQGLAQEIERALFVRRESERPSFPVMIRQWLSKSATYTLIILTGKRRACLDFWAVLDLVTAMGISGQGVAACESSIDAEAEWSISASATWGKGLVKRFQRGDQPAWISTC
jgi:hypothetical protein